MARLDALGLLKANGTDEALLNELYNQFIENVEARAVSIQLKNPNYTGDVDAGSVVAKRLSNATSKAYGTARASQAGEKSKIDEVVIKIDQEFELIKEFEAYDLKRLGFPALVSKEVKNHRVAMVRDLDTKFFKEAYATGTEVTHTATDWIGKLEEMIVKLQSVSNDYIDGVERDMARLVVTPSVMSAVRIALDDLPANDNTFAKGAVGLFHGVPIWESVHLPKATDQVVDAFCMVEGAIAQPVSITPYEMPERIQLSKAFSIELYYDFGTKALTPELIMYSGDTFVA
jgi:hypothetical protein